jgi:hypothetical protein
MTELENMAFNSAVDYKPFDLQLNYSLYYQKGFEVGFLRALEILENSGLEELKKIVQDKDKI